MIRTRRRFLRVLFLCFILAAIVETAAPGKEIGVRTKYREIDRLHSDSESIGSRISILNNNFFLDYDIAPQFSLLYNEGRERWALAHPDGTRYFAFAFLRHIPRLKYQAEKLGIDLALSIVDVDSGDELYSRIEEDDQNQFILPALIARYTVSDLEFQLGGWRETDVQPFNYYRYALVIYETLLCKTRFQITENQSVAVDFRKIDRIYPEDYDLKKNEVRGIYRIFNPIEIVDDIAWREISLELVETRYEDISAYKADLSDYFKFSLLGLTHFLTHRLRYTNVVTTYHEGIYPYSLIENDQVKNDLWQQFEYAGFWKISDTRFYLSWKFRVEDSLIENVIIDQDAELKLTFVF